MPAWILGCRVFTLPSKISLKPVKSDTSVHLKPNLLIFLYVPPELIILTLFFFNIRNINDKLFLSDTEIRADLIFFYHILKNL